jgi:hypothetical protein
MPDVVGVLESVDQNMYATKRDDSLGDFGRMAQKRMWGDGRHLLTLLLFAYVHESIAIAKNQN